MDYPHLDKIVADAVRLGPARVAVCFPCSASSIEAALMARQLGLIDPIFVGPRARIEAIAAKSLLDLDDIEFRETGESPADAAIASTKLCREGRASLLMKGSLHTDELMAAVVDRVAGLRTNRRTSHAFVLDLPSYSKPLLIADCVVNIAPSLMDKRDIAQSAIDLAHIIGVRQPYVGVLSAVETVNPAIPGTVDAAALSKMAQRGQITGALVDGPLAFDVAISFEAAQIKGLATLSSERPDILVVPNLEAGNLLYKQFIYLGKGECAGIVLGTAAPIILTSRADSGKSRVASCALAALYADAMRGGSNILQ